MSSPAATDDGGDIGSDKSKGGRHRAPDYNSVENLAVAMAAQRAAVKPDQTLPELEAGTSKLYGHMLKEAVSIHGWPKNSKGCLVSGPLLSQSMLPGATGALVHASLHCRRLTMMW